MVITVKDLVSGCNTNAEGDIVRMAILNGLASAQVVTVTFSGLTGATTSFVNSAFLDLLDVMTFDDIKACIRITQSSRQINDLIKSSLTHVTSKQEKAA